jgi:hypothetical protein
VNLRRACAIATAIVLLFGCEPIPEETEVMSTKPSALPRWADVGGLIVIPTSGKQDIGFARAERPPAEYLNHLLNLAYLWHQHFSDGDWVGPITVDGSSIDPQTATDEGTITAVDGNLVASGDAAELKGLVDANVLLFSRPERMKFSAMSGNAGGTTAESTTSGWVEAAGPGDIWRHGADAIVSDSIYGHVLSQLRVNTSRAGSGTITVALKKVNAAGAVSTIASVTRNSGTGWATGTAAIADHIVEGGSFYYFETIFGDTGDLYAGAIVDVTKRHID